MTEPAQMVEEVAESDTIPDSQVYFPPTIKPKPSTCTPRATSSGVCSHNAILNRNATELWRYLLSNLRPPQMAVQVSGTHGYPNDEDYSTDFYLKIDVSNEVIPQWSRIVTTGPDEGTTICQTLEKYASNHNPFKEFRLKKVVVWDMTRLRSLIVDVVKATGYGTDPCRSEAISVSLRMGDDEVVALASNGLSRSAHNKYVQCLCWVSCLCCVFCPAWELVRDSPRNRLECEYGMAVSADDFVATNSARIRSAVVWREGCYENLEGASGSESRPPINEWEWKTRLEQRLANAERKREFTRQLKANTHRVNE